MKRTTSTKIAFNVIYNVLFNRLSFSFVIMELVMDFCKIYNFAYCITCESSRPEIQLYRL